MKLAPLIFILIFASFWIVGLSYTVWQRHLMFKRFHDQNMGALNPKDCSNLTFNGGDVFPSSCLPYLTTLSVAEYQNATHLRHNRQTSLYRIGDKYLQTFCLDADVCEVIRSDSSGATTGPR